MSLASRLRALERTTESLRRQHSQWCPECGARFEENPVAVIWVDETLPSDKQKDDLARACFLGQKCSTCNRYVDDDGRAIPGQGEHIKVYRRVKRDGEWER